MTDTTKLQAAWDYIVEHRERGATMRGINYNLKSLGYNVSKIGIESFMVAMESKGFYLSEEKRHNNIFFRPFRNSNTGERFFDE